LESPESFHIFICPNRRQETVQIVDLIFDKKDADPADSQYTPVNQIFADLAISRRQHVVSLTTVALMFVFPILIGIDPSFNKIH